MGNEIYLYEQGQQRLRGDEMYPLIDKEATGKQIKRFMDCRGITVKQVQGSFRIILCARNLSLVEWNQFAIVG